MCVNDDRSDPEIKHSYLEFADLHPLMVEYTPTSKGFHLVTLAPTEVGDSVTSDGKSELLKPLDARKSGHENTGP